jgi:hypothetical protein
MPVPFDNVLCPGCVPADPLISFGQEHLFKIYININGLIGAQGRNRTTDTAIFSRMLYQLSYLGI